VHHDTGGKCGTTDYAAHPICMAYSSQIELIVRLASNKAGITSTMAIAAIDKAIKEMLQS
ncbi:hypothetical protein, partial [Escherichia coli]|uniref:hypothetical protein n=1 Tax=Escherichia coli TaxID=562 RepID=UPI00386228EC